MHKGSGPRSLEELNGFSKGAVRLFFLFVILFAIGIIGLIGYNKYENSQKVALQTRDYSYKVFDYAQNNSNTENEFIEYLNGNADPIKSLKIGSKKLQYSTDSENPIADVSGADYAQVDYFRIKDSNYYTRLVYKHTSLDILGARFLTKNEYKSFIKYDELQSDYASELDKGNTNSGKENMIKKMISSEPYLSN